MKFKPNRRFQIDYNHLFRINPEMANLHLLLSELAVETGQVRLGPNPESKLAELMEARFENPQAYQLNGGSKR